MVTSLLCKLYKMLCYSDALNVKLLQLCEKPHLYPLKLFPSSFVTGSDRDITFDIDLNDTHLSTLLRPSVSMQQTSEFHDVMSIVPMSWRTMTQLNKATHGVSIWNSSVRKATWYRIFKHTAITHMRYWNRYSFKMDFSCWNIAYINPSRTRSMYTSSPFY